MSTTVITYAGPSQRRRRASLALLLTAVLTLTAALTRPGDAEAADPPNQVGIVCTEGVGGNAENPVFNLTTKTGYISLPDGNTAYMWGYSSGFDGFQHPSPVLCVDKGDTVTVILHNTLTEPVSIDFPGHSDVLADGLPTRAERAGGRVTSLTDTADPLGGTITYSFVADKPGTFIYQSGTNPETQVRMGLFGALVVRPDLGADHAYDQANSRFTPSEEFLVLLSEIDPYQHRAVELGRDFNINKYKPRYWLINGRGFPDSLADNGASWLPAQPYGALAQIQEFDEVTHPQPGLARYINVGSEDYPFHPHGNNGAVIGRDGRPLTGDGGEDLSFEKFSINLGPGQTWDVLFRWYDENDYGPGNPVPVTEPDLKNTVIGTFYSGSPYLGSARNLPPGTPTLNQCGEFYIISHNHALYQITSWGATMTGPITYLRVDPADTSNCG